ncbi:MAG: phosphomannomutase/phosphoglucomutase [Micavibrio aeruginosavorus]|uniref:Phosphomannomutase/phosphoglucomutase n=1 Tax=Micavibrio aeruginosavorus TaxID=349221 RepID=A0A2W5PWW2_9BACT|nr:MAG: phosphomannomutase/phosphoglucomutase [Micavibrio aeruginosavorus]
MTKTDKKIVANTEAYEREVLCAPEGFREYDARWLHPEQLNLRGAQKLGLGIATIMHEMGKNPPAIVVGHDYRSYSASIKQAVIIGLVEGGCQVKDIGLALSPVSYFAQFELDCPAVAMVTASHNENGWTGVKIGAERPMTFGPELMGRLKEIVLNDKGVARDGGSYSYIDDMKERYLKDVTKDGKLNRKLKVVCACGNGTAGVFAPDALRAIGCEVIEMDCELDYTFPRYNPNPEDLEMLHAIAAKVKETGADIGFGFDGDGDRCGVIDNTGDEIFADKIGVILARDLAKIHKNPTFVVDVKSTGLYHSDPELKALNVTTDYWKTGHSYIKRRVNELSALAGFEKSGHFFLNDPIGRGYDDGVLTAVTICRMLDRNAGKSMSDLKDALPKTFGSPTMSPYCPDDKKYGVVDAIIKKMEDLFAKGEEIIGSKIDSVVTVNGVRFTLEDGTWGLIRASSNKPSLVVVVESPVSDARLREIFAYIEDVLASFKDVGEYDQKLPAAKAA